MKALLRFRAPPPRPLQASLAVLHGLEDVARDRPLLVVVEDVHRMSPWLVDLVGFTARRLSRVPILLLVTSQPGSAALAERYKLPRLDLVGLDRTGVGQRADDGPDLWGVTTTPPEVEAATGGATAPVPSTARRIAASPRGAPPDHLDVTAAVRAFAANVKRPRTAQSGAHPGPADAPAVQPTRHGGRPAALTAGELKVCRLAAEGLTNRQIADRVFLSHRTVGGHLYTAFTKLGVERRSQLHDALNDPRRG